jgi:hypothetical protein
LLNSWDCFSGVNGSIQFGSLVRGDNSLFGYLLGGIQWNILCRIDWSVSAKILRDISGSIHSLIGRSVCSHIGLYLISNVQCGILGIVGHLLFADHRLNLGQSLQILVILWLEILQEGTNVGCENWGSVGGDVLGCVDMDFLTLISLDQHGSIRSNVGTSRMLSSLVMLMMVTVLLVMMLMFLLNLRFLRKTLRLLNHSRILFLLSHKLEFFLTQLLKFSSLLYKILFFVLADICGNLTLQSLGNTCLISR